MTSSALHIPIVCDYFKAFWGPNGTPSVIDRLTAPDFVLHYRMNKPRLGREAAKAFMTAFRLAVPDLAFVARSALTERDFVILEWSGGGTHTGPAFDDFNLTPLPAGSTRKIGLSGHTAYRMRDGLIVEEAIWSLERMAERQRMAGSSIL